MERCLFIPTMHPSSPSRSDCVCIVCHEWRCKHVPDYELNYTKAQLESYRKEHEYIEKMIRSSSRPLSCYIADLLERAGERG